MRLLKFAIFFGLFSSVTTAYAEPLPEKTLQKLQKISKTAKESFGKDDAIKWALAEYALSKFAEDVWKADPFQDFKNKCDPSLISEVKDNLSTLTALLENSSLISREDKQFYRTVSPHFYFGSIYAGTNPKTGEKTRGLCDELVEKVCKGISIVKGVGIRNIVLSDCTKHSYSSKDMEKVQADHEKYFPEQSLEADRLAAQQSIEINKICELRYSQGYRWKPEVEVLNQKCDKEK